MRWVRCTLVLLLSMPAVAEGRPGFIARWLAAYSAHSAAPDGAALGRVARAGLGLPRNSEYDSAYFKLKYPGGDAPADRGVCTDVVVRTFLALGIDLQKAVHEDMISAPSAYPHLWKRQAPDSNIDHRRVPNLMVFFSRHGETLPLSRKAGDYLPGEIVAWDLGAGVTHVGLVVPGPEHPLILHHIGGRGPQVEDVLFDWRLIGHFRYLPAAR